MREHRDASSSCHARVVPREGRFFVERPKDLRAATLWHGHGYHRRVLRGRLEALSRHLGVTDGARVLDYGCGDVPYRHFFPRDVDYVAADLPGNALATLTLSQDATVPVPDGSFDAVVSTQVLEHVSDPGLYLSECLRVLRPGGRLLLSTHGAFAYHPDPVDFWRWTCAGLRRIVEEQGFRVVEFEGIIGLAATGIQLVQDALHHHGPPRRAAQLLAVVAQGLMTLADRLESKESRDLNGQVFGLVAERP